MKSILTCLQSYHVKSDRRIVPIRVHNAVGGDTDKEQASILACRALEQGSHRAGTVIPGVRDRWIPVTPYSSVPLHPHISRYYNDVDYDPCD